MKARFLIKILIATILFVAILFLFAGKINYFEGWIFLATNTQRYFQAKFDYF